VGESPSGIRVRHSLASGRWHGRMECPDQIGHFVVPIRKVGAYMAVRKICPDAVRDWQPRGSPAQPVASNTENGPVGGIIHASGSRLQTRLQNPVNRRESLPSLRTNTQVKDHSDHR
jgi:hypothetical protein